MTDQWTDRLSEYVDGELGAADVRSVEAHLETCGTCRTTVAELRRVVARAAALDDRPPVADLWPGIAARIGHRVPVADRRRTGRRTFRLSLSQLAAAAALFLVVGAGGATVVLRRSPRVRTEAVPAIAASNGSFDVTVAGLEETLRAHRHELDSATVRVIEQNLAIIDRAIAEARAALASDPSDIYLTTHLAATMERKVDLLRRAAALVEG